MKKKVAKILACLMFFAFMAPMVSSCDKCGNGEEYEWEEVDDAGEVHVYKDVRCG